MEFLSGDSRNPSRGEGRDVGLGARISKHIPMFAFSYLSKLYSLYILHCYYCLFIHIWYCSCVHTCIDPRELLKYLNFYKRGILRRSSRALHWEFNFTLWIHLFYCKSFKSAFDYHYTYSPPLGVLLRIATHNKNYYHDRSPHNKDCYHARSPFYKYCDHLFFHCVPVSYTHLTLPTIYSV